MVQVGLVPDPTVNYSLVITMTKLNEIYSFGQSIWYDNIRRALLDFGDLDGLLKQGVMGVTSNPTIFEKAIAGSADYDAQLRDLAAQGASVDAMYEALVLEDIARAADLLRPTYDNTNGVDGYISLEVSPTLARNTADTVAQAQRLFATLKRPNVMIKVPATPEGIPAIRQLISEGINVNVTLIFSLTQYDAVAEAYIGGLEQRHANGGDIGRIASVASFFVSRVDSALDKTLAEKGAPELVGKIAIANAKLAYARFGKLFSGARWKKLAQAGARVQRPLWASTGVKNPALPDTLYIDALIGPDTVNTVPPATLQAILLRASPARTLDTGLAEAKAQIAQLKTLGIDLDAVTQTLQDEGVASFEKSFESLMGSIQEKRERLLDEQAYQAALGDYQSAVTAAQDEISREQILSRIWAHDHTVWKSEPTEITNRLGWLHSPEVMREGLSDIAALVDAVRKDGYTQAVLLGMGGSSLAPEVFQRTFGVQPGYLDLMVLDSTHPDAVRAMESRLDLAHTLFIVSTKSGGTVETFSFFKYFYNQVQAVVGDTVNQHFIAITDPNSGLEDTAKKYRFRHIFLNDPNIGGRYSALSYFGLVPAALIGVDVAQVLDHAERMAHNSDNCNCALNGDNYGARLGAAMGELAVRGRDKVTIVTSPSIAAFGGWAEQLIAESTGKEGKGILPVADETLGAPDAYAQDRLFVYVRLTSDTNEAVDAQVAALQTAGQPVIRMNLSSRYDIGGQFFLWEMATVLAGRRLAINPFDQPNVESAKVLTREMVAAYQRNGVLPAPEPTLHADGIRTFANVPGESLYELMGAFLAQAHGGDYIAMQAYVPPSPATTETLQALRLHLRDRLKLATTLGYGPRFLHSTGQLHKGDNGNGLFIQIAAAAQQDADIPNEAGASNAGVTAASTMSFGTLIQAQGLGDRQALLNNARRVIRFELTGDLTVGLNALLHAAQLASQAAIMREMGMTLSSGEVF